MCGEYSDAPAGRLLQVKMNIIPYDTCRRVSESHINDTVHICAGSVPTRDINICKVGVCYYYYCNFCCYYYLLYAMLLFCYKAYL